MKGVLVLFVGLLFFVWLGFFFSSYCRARNSVFLDSKAGRVYLIFCLTLSRKILQAIFCASIVDIFAICVYESELEGQV